MILQTKRLLLRRAVRDDIDAIIHTWTDPEVMKFMGGPRDPQKVREAIEKNISSMKEPIDIWPLVEIATGNIIGDCGFVKKKIEDKDEIEIIYILKKEKQGMGYATEIALELMDYALRNIKLNRLIALIDPLNYPSEKVALKIGMKNERMIDRNGKTMKLYSISSGII